MPILKIARMGHPVLLTPSAPVEDVNLPEIQALIASMAETLADAGGVGLAAPQVHIGLRLFLFTVPANRTDDGQALPLRAVVNPVVTALTAYGQDVGWEGCLSIPGLRAGVPRWREIHLAGYDAQGQAFEERLSGFAARVVQHEVDHLDGILYPMRMENFRLFGYSEELERYPPEAL